MKFEIRVGACSTEVWQNEDFSYSFQLPGEKVKRVNYIQNVGECLTEIVDALSIENSKMDSKFDHEYVVDEAVNIGM